MKAMLSYYIQESNKNKDSQMGHTKVIKKIKALSQMYHKLERQGKARRVG
jgi:hypothetical protein